MPLPVRTVNKAAFANELKTDHSPVEAPKLNDPATLDALVKANAVIGMVPKGGRTTPLAGPTFSLFFYRFPFFNTFHATPTFRAYRRA